LTVILIPWSIL